MPEPTTPEEWDNERQELEKVKAGDAAFKALFGRYDISPPLEAEEVVTTSRAKPEAPSTSGIPNRPDQVNQFSFYDDPDPVEPPTPVESPPTIDAPGVDPIWDQDQSPEAATERMRQDAIRFNEQVGSWLPKIARDYDFHTQPFVEYDVWRDTWFAKNAPGLAGGVRYDSAGNPDPKGDFIHIRAGAWEPEAFSEEGKEYHNHEKPENYLKDKYMHKKLKHDNWKLGTGDDGNKYTIDHLKHRFREHGNWLRRTRADLPGHIQNQNPGYPGAPGGPKRVKSRLKGAVDRKIEGASDAAKDSLMALFARLILPAGVTVTPRRKAPAPEPPSRRKVSKPPEPQQDLQPGQPQGWLDDAGVQWYRHPNGELLRFNVTTSQWEKP